MTKKRHYKNYSGRISEFWNSCGKGFAHISQGYLKWQDMSQEHRLAWALKLAKKYNLTVDKIKQIFNKSVVIDYGTGSGYLGLALQILDISKYIGIDIANRQLKVASKTLKDISAEFYLAPVEFSEIKADVFISHACIQHFPDEAYIVSFLKNLNNSNIQHIFLQYRHSEKPKFVENDPGQSCSVNSNFIKEHLDYELVSLSEVGRANYQFSYWRKLG